jgi:signal transduction histidine kinase
VETGFRLEDATGLGLSIVRTLVTTELNGTISMTPNPPRGTLVELTIPLSEE